MRTLPETKPALTGGKGFASRQYVVDYLGEGKLPDIHDDIGIALSMVTDRKGLIDLGACTGLLTVRAHNMGFSPVIGLEYEQADVDVFTAYLAEPGRELRQFVMDPMDDANMGELKSIIKKNKVTTILARRCLPECLGCGKDGKDMHPDAPERLAAVFHSAGITRIVLEGRAVSTRTTHLLGTVEKEIEVMSSHFELIFRMSECAIMRARTL